MKVNENQQIQQNPMQTSQAHSTENCRLIDFLLDPLLVLIREQRSRQEKQFKNQIFNVQNFEGKTSKVPKSPYTLKKILASKSELFESEHFSYQLRMLLMVVPHTSRL